MSDQYEPELGQLAFGQPNKEYKASHLLIAVLASIRDELLRCEYNVGQLSFDPFGNTGSKFKNDVFEVEAYSWDKDYEQPYNFKYKNIEVSWYKWLGRGMSVNRVLTYEDLNNMLEDCLKSLE